MDKLEPVKVSSKHWVWSPNILLHHYRQILSQDPQRPATLSLV